MVKELWLTFLCAIGIHGGPWAVGTDGKQVWEVCACGECIDDIH